MVRKFKCIKGNKDKESWLTKDKIYEEDENGDIQFDCGMNWKLTKDSNFDGHKIIGYYLIEIKEEENKVKEFKVGDRVKIIGNSNAHDYKIGDIVELIGERIKSCIHDGYFFKTKMVGEKFSPRCLNVLEQDMELISTNNNQKSIHITFDNNTTHAVLKDGKSIIKRVSVGLYHDDEYKFETGVVEVVKKLLEVVDEKVDEVEVEPKKFVKAKVGGNFEVRCIRNDGDDIGLTVGKIYKVINGYSKWDDGTKMPSYIDNGISKFNNFEDLNKWFNDGDYGFELINSASKQLCDYTTDEILEELKRRMEK